MFHIKHFVHKLNLSPQFLGPNMHVLIQEDLIRKVEGSCSPAGYIISILHIENISHGKILLSGQIAFSVNYQALVLCPSKGEVVDAPIVSASKLGFFAGIGPLSIFISNYQIPQNLQEELGNNIVVRLRIIGMKIDSSRVYAVGTLNDDCLGVIS
ncbi:DNA-directed RNA polymerase II subunit RPB7 [Pancytospora epiphaga]|nr:DNA-directed RNA polymerase II subunit RPB7 [Pancytospora epiphaga]